MFVSRFGISIVLMLDNGKQFNSNNFMEFYMELGLKQQFTLAKHSQSNNQVELVKKVNLNGLKK